MDSSPASTFRPPAIEALLRESAARLLAGPPPDIAHIQPEELRRHLDWVIDTACGEFDPPADEHGALLVLRRRLLDLLRGDLLESWSDAPPPARTMLQTLEQLEKAGRACVPPPEHSLHAELADHGALDLVVEVGHDMRSPLTSILFLAETLHRGQSGPLNDVQKRQVGIVYSAALGLVGMASDMMEVARGGDRLAGKQPVPFSVNEVLRSVSSLVRPTVEEKGLGIEIDQLAAEHRVGYPVPLSRVLLNLTTNALKFTQEGRVHLSASGAGGSVVEFAVRDTGPGIPADMIDSIYEPFRREPARRSGYYFSGSGLGLSICRRLVHAMGSELQLETREGHGTRFSFRLDLPPAELL